MEKLSIAANAFAVVGLADVVFRLGIEAFDLYSHYRNASKNVPRLVTDLKTLADIVAQVRVFVDEYNRSPYMLEDSQALLPQLESALQACKRELEELKGVIENVKTDASDGWLKRWSKGLSCALDDQKILGSCQQIERSNVVLNTALSLTGRQNEIILRRELKAVRKDVAEAQTSANANLLSIKQDITASQNIQEGTERVSAAILSAEQANSTSFRTVNRSLASGHAKLKALNTAIDGHAGIVNRRLSAVNKRLAGCRNEQGALIRLQKTSASKLRTQLDAVCSNLTQQIATIGFRETEHNDIVFEGENLDAIALPLMLMQTDLAKAIRTLAIAGTVKVSHSEARWIQEEIENLLVCGHESAALANRKRSSKTHTRSTNSFAAAVPTRTTSSRIVSSKNSCRSQNNLSALVSKFETAIRFQQRHRFHTAAGMLVIEAGAHDVLEQGHGQYSSSLLAFRISFFPKLDLSPVSMTASLFKHLGMGMDMEPQIARAVWTYNTIHHRSRAILCAQNNDVVGLQKLFKDGEASPHDCDEDGDSLLMHAAYRGKFEAYKFLLREGANALMFSAGSTDGTGLLWNLWTELREKVLHFADSDYESAPSTRTLEVLTENLQLMTADAIERGCDPNMVTISRRENLLHLFVESYAFWRDCGGRRLSNDQISGFIRHAIAMGCDLEARDSSGKTPLLTACQYHQYHIFLFLIKQGAKVTSIDNNGQNALHLLLDQPTKLTKLEQGHLEAALVLAIVNECDPNGLSIERGLSPTEYATAGYGWVPWTQALATTNSQMEPADSVSDDVKLPFSEMTTGSWRAERSRIREEYEERESAHGSECDHDALESLSVASVDYENITEWVYDDSEA
ncbi:hypothetical protein BGZ57DRAFT_998065 [Hyaloscypha finlandica]|nr:hypothetical protein BGZ57DRAFT_998065 [Hyaloscypha finlandica]